MSARTESEVIASIAMGIATKRIPLNCADRFDKDPLWMLGERTVVEEVTCKLPVPELNLIRAITVDLQGKPLGVGCHGGPILLDFAARDACVVEFFTTLVADGMGCAASMLMCGVDCSAGQQFVMHQGVHGVPELLKDDGHKGFCHTAFKLVGDGVILLPNNRYVTRRFQTGVCPADAIVEGPSGPPVLVQFVSADDGTTHDAGAYTINCAQVPTGNGASFASCSLGSEWPVSADCLDDTVAIITVSRDRPGEHRLLVFTKSGPVFGSEHFTFKSAVSAPVLLSDGSAVVAIDGFITVFRKGKPPLPVGRGGCPVRMFTGDVLFSVGHEGKRKLAILESARDGIKGYLPAMEILDDRYLAKYWPSHEMTIFEYVAPDHIVANVSTIGSGIRAFKRTQHGFRAVVVDPIRGRDTLIDFWRGKVRRLEADWDEVDINQVAAVGDRLVGVGKFGNRWSVVNGQGKLGKPADRIWRLRVKDNTLRWDALRNCNLFSCLARAKAD